MKGGRLRTCLWIGVLLALCMGGGCVSPEQREAAIEKGAREAQSYAREKAYDEAISKGVAEPQARELANTAGTVAYEAAKKAAEQVPSSGGLGQVLSTLLYGLVNFGLPLLGRKGGTA